MAVHMHATENRAGEPGLPWQNPFVESLNGRFRDEFLDVVQFSPGRGARVLIEHYR